MPDKTIATVRNDRIHKDAIKKEVTCKYAWKKNWRWLVNEYITLQKDLAKITETKPMTELEKKLFKTADPRTIKPVPPTVNGEYGWICSKEEFRLNKWGPDVPSFSIDKKYIEP